MMRRIAAAFMMIAMLFAACSCELNITPDANGRVYIVTVGIDYANSPVSDLQGTVDDALEMAECLKAVYEAKNTGTVVRRMIQEGEDSDRTSQYYPSAENILRMISSLDAGPDDLVVFFYSGHGDVHRDEETERIVSNFLAAAPYSDEGDRRLYTELDTDVLFSALNELPCPAVAIIDACYSGGAADNHTEPSFAESFVTMLSGVDLRDAAVIAASQPDQLSYVASTTTEEGEIERHSHLTIAVLRALGWKHSSTKSVLVEADGKIRRVSGYLGTAPTLMTAEDLFSRVKSSWTVANQTPMFGKSSAGIIVVPKG